MSSASILDIRASTRVLGSKVRCALFLWWLAVPLGTNALAAPLMILAVAERKPSALELILSGISKSEFNRPYCWVSFLCFSSVSLVLPIPLSCWEMIPQSNKSHFPL